MTGNETRAGAAYESPCGNKILPSGSFATLPERMQKWQQPEEQPELTKGDGKANGKGKR